MLETTSPHPQPRGPVLGGYSVARRRLLRFPGRGHELPVVDSCNAIWPDQPDLLRFGWSTVSDTPVHYADAPQFCAELKKVILCWTAARTWSCSKMSNFEPDCAERWLPSCFGYGLCQEIFLFLLCPTSLLFWKSIWNCSRILNTFDLNVNVNVKVNVNVTVYVNEYQKYECEWNEYEMFMSFWAIIMEQTWGD